MSDTKLQPVLEMATALREAEAAIAVALTKSAVLTQQLPETWAALGISPVVGRGAFDRAGQIVSGMTTVWCQLGEFHSLLESVREKLGLPAVTWGDKGLTNGDAPAFTS